MTKNLAVSQSRMLKLSLCVRCLLQETGFKFAESDLFDILHCFAHECNRKSLAPN